MNMLKIDALIQCRSHWQWIYDNTERLMLKNLLITADDIKSAKKHCIYDTEDFPSLFAVWWSSVSARNIIAACRNAKGMVDACTLALEKE